VEVTNVVAERRGRAREPYYQLTEGERSQDPPTELASFWELELWVDSESKTSLEL
jgi:hypothetical protein